jgi:hypothetical protein
MKLKKVKDSIKISDIAPLLIFDAKIVEILAIAKSSLLKVIRENVTKSLSECY